LAAASLTVILAFPSTVYADDVDTPQEIVLPTEDFTTLVGLAGQVDPLKAERDALEKSLANMTEQRDHAIELARVRGELRDGYRELAEINQAKYIATKDRLADVVKQKRSEGFWKDVQLRASQGALVGGLIGTAAPGIGNLAGLVGGGILGGIVGAIEGLVETP
jgi:hypothetical protein